MAVMQAFYDASEIGDHVAVGGLLFRKKNVRPFEKRWRAMLRKYEIDYFHMTDCNVAEGPFAGKSEDECIACAKEAISIILEFVAKGIICSVSKTDFDEIIGANGVMPNPFTLAVWFALIDIRYWADTNDPTARIAYVFESGDKHQADAERLLTGVAEDSDRAAVYRYNGHAFHPKRASLPTQAADILAWHGAKQMDRNDRGIRRLRGDFEAIVSRLHVSDARQDRAALEQIVKIAREKVASGISGLPIPPEHADEFVRLSFLANRSNVRQSIARAIEMLRPCE